MKYKNKVKKLKDRQAWYDKQPESYKRSCKRPGSIKLK